MRRIPAWLALGAAGLLAAAPAVAAERAAPTYVTSDPQNGATVDSPPSRVSVTFSEPLDAGSTLQVFDECGRAVDAGDAQVLGSRIDVGIARTPSGHYTAVYLAKGFGGATGETKGSISFHVTSGEACDGSDEHDHHAGGSGDDDDHEGHDGGKGGDGGHEGDHGDGGGGDEGHDDHEGMAGDDHGGSGGSHGDGGHGDGEHGKGGHDGPGHGDAHNGGGRDHSGTHSDRGGDGDASPDLAAGRGPGLAPTSTSVLIALALSVGMGALGGWVLRVSAGS